MSQEVLEGNKLIAEFMELEFIPEHRDEYENFTPDKWKDKNGAKHEWLGYHTSWDWLLSAWRKLYLLLGDVSITIQNEMGEPESALSYWYRQMEQPITKVLIDPAHKTLVKAITFYNQTQKK